MVRKLIISYWLLIIIWSLVIGHWSLSEGQYVALDPTRHVPNARVLGLGKAYTALADDTGAMYTNPAGLVGAYQWQVTSMSGKFLDEYSYLSLSGFYPTTFGVFGVGYAGTSIAGAFATTIEAGSDPADPLYTFDFSQPEMRNNNDAFVFSYAQELAKIDLLKKVPGAEKTSFGASVKLFRVGLTGDGITGGNASGQEFDLGMKFSWQPWLKLGAVVQNLLPTSAGGKLRYDSGHEESYPAVLEAGTAINILGKENALRKWGEQDLKLMIDLDRQFTLSNYPTIWHVGLEWQPTNLIAIRAAIDQDAVGNGSGGLTTTSDQAYGVGLFLGGFRFDYAYHTFAGSPGLDNHYFSLSYGLIPKKIADPILVDVPADKSITFEARTAVSGKVMDSAVRTLLVNNISAKLSLRGDFSSVADYKIGKNAILLEGKDDGGKKIAFKKVRVLRLNAFPDVPEGYWVRVPISLLAMANLITGYPDGSFKPEGNITRAEMCTLLMKSGGKVAAKLALPFSDVSANHWAASYIAQAAENGVVKGYPDGGFRPNGNITRAEGLAMIARFAKVSEEVAAKFTLPFPDIDSTHWAAKIVSGASRASLLEYLKGKAFEPNRKLTRSETVEMLQRTAYVQDLLKKDLLNWETY